MLRGSVAVLVLTIVYTALGCGFGRLVRDHRLIAAVVGLATLALLLALLVCDPVVNGLSTEILSGLAILAFVTLVLRYVIRLQQGPPP